MNKDFKPCPFCGRSPEVTQRAFTANEVSPTGRRFFAACHGGGYSTHAQVHAVTREALLVLWNTRYKG